VIQDGMISDATKVRLRPGDRSVLEVRLRTATTEQRQFLIYCSDYRCGHSIAISADPWPDQVRLSDLEPHFVWKACRQEGSPTSDRIFTGRAPRLWRWAIAEVSVRLSAARHLAMGFMELLLFIFGH
jgi:hypothetical protein